MMQDRERLESAMSRALALAHRSPAQDANPQVGCVIIDPEGRIVAEGWHRGAGTPHAEVDALAHLPGEWRARARDLTALVTLEPCNHTGRTGPCAVALTEAGIGAVAYALGDPSQAAGGGAETLRSAGVAVLGGVLAGEAAALLAPWLARQGTAPHRNEHDEHDEHSVVPGAAPGSAPDSAPRTAPSSVPRTARPFVTAKWAQTLDGRAAAADGSSQWITGPEARADVHRRRAGSDAILIGTGTLVADDPALTARAADGRLLVPADRQPIPVVVGRRPIPPGARVRSHPALEARGLDEPIRLSGDDLRADLASLTEQGIRSVFVEGGPAVTSSLIAAGLVDELLVYVAPALLGGPRLAIGDIGVASMAGIKRLRVTGTERLGDDTLIITAPIITAPEQEAA